MIVKKDNSEIHRLYKELVARASNISDFQVGQIRDVKYDITELANNCVNAIDSEDYFWSDVYYSALMVRYWHMIAKLYDRLKSYKISVEEVVNVLYESLTKAMRYRSWLDETKYISKESKGAEKVINQCITSTISNYIKALNTNAVKMIVDNKDEDFDNSVYDNDSYYDYFGCKELVQKLIDKDNYITAMTVEYIAYKDMSSRKLLVNKMSKLTDDDILSFIRKYKIKDENLFVTQLRKFINLSDRDKTKEINKSIKYLKNNEDFVRSYLC